LQAASSIASLTALSASALVRGGFPTGP
jgi:hypothetical protein